MSWVWTWYLKFFGLFIYLFYYFYFLLSVFLAEYLYETSVIELKVVFFFKKNKNILERGVFLGKI